MSASCQIFFKLCIYLAVVCRILGSTLPDQDVSKNSKFSRRSITSFHTLQARQERKKGEKKKKEVEQSSPPQQLQGAPPGSAAATADAAQSAPGLQAGAPQRGSPQEQAAGQMVQMLLQMGEALEAVTSMGSNSTIVLAASEAVLKMVPEMSKARSALQAAVPQKPELAQLVTKADSAGEKIAQIVKTIQAAPDDANNIKKNFEGMGTAFGEIFLAAEGLINGAFPGALPTGSGAGQGGGAPQQLNQQPKTEAKDKKDTK